MDELTESMSVSQEDLLDISSPRRRRKGTVDQPAAFHCLYDTSAAEDDPSVSAGEVSQRARRRRKETHDESSSGRMAEAGSGGGGWASQDELKAGARDYQRNSGDELPRRGRESKSSFDERRERGAAAAAVSGDELSRRGERTRAESKTSGDELSRRGERTRETKNQSGDELSRREKPEAGSGLKRRNTAKKLDHEKARSSVSRQDKLSTLKQDKRSSTEGRGKRDQDKTSREQQHQLQDADTDKSESDESLVAKDQPDIDEKNVTFCMWGHENCRTRSHYRYNWQWDYVQKYVDQHNKNVISGFTPREKSIEEQLGGTASSQEVSNKSNKPGKEGIKIRMQMLQNRLKEGKTSGTMKQNIFERDLELEILRRKRNYKF